MRFHPLRTLSQLESLSVDELDRFTRQAVRQLSTRKVLLGRCLVALDLHRRARKLGCSSSIHYARLLGVEYREALEVRRVARCLEKLPQLRAAAEEGSIPWASLREIVRKASPETEARWLVLAGQHPYRTIEKLVRSTKRGEMPGDPNLAGDLPPLDIMLRILTSHVAAAMLEKVSRDRSEKLGGAMSLGEALEWLCVHYQTGALTEKARDRCTREILKDISAEFAAHPTSNPQVAGPDFGDTQAARDEAHASEFADPSARVDANSEAEPARVIFGGADAAPARGRSEFAEAQAYGNRDTEPVRVIYASSDAASAEWGNDRLRYRADARLTPAQRREMLRRDGYCCSAPGCPNRLWLDVHHVLYFSQGGSSFPENLCVLCSMCHRNLHEGWLFLVGEAPDFLFWFDPHHDPLMRPRLHDLQPEEERNPNYNYEELYGLVEDAPQDPESEAR